MLRSALFATAMVAVVAIFAACSDTNDETSHANAGGKTAAFRGVYRATAAGGIGDLAFTEDDRYVLRPEGCHETRCLEAGTVAFDANARTLTLRAEGRDEARVYRVEIAATETFVRPATIAPRDLTESEHDQPLVAGGEPALLDTIRDAKLNGQPVELLDGKTSDDGGAGDGGNGNAERSPWPGVIPGTGPIRAPVDGEVTTDHPPGNAVTVARPGDPAFANDPALAQRYAGLANVYNSHGMPGILFGGIPEERVRQFLNGSNDPLIVAACFSGAAMTGGSDIRRLVSAYADDPSAASRVYGCTGWTMDYQTASGGGYACTGAWVDANQRAVPLVERQRLGLVQMRCSTNTIDGGRPTWDDCHDMH